MSRARRLGRWARLLVCLGGFVAAAMVPSDGRALAPGGIVIWFDDITNTAHGTADICVSISMDMNGDENGNAGKSTITKDKNGDSTGNSGVGGGPSICF